MEIREEPFPQEMKKRTRPGSFLGGVFQRNFDMPQASFDGMQDACDYANEIAKTRLNSMVLIRKKRDPAANPETKSACDSSGK